MDSVQRKIRPVEQVEQPSKRVKTQHPIEYTNDIKYEIYSNIKTTK